MQNILEKNNFYDIKQVCILNILLRDHEFWTK